MPPMLRHPDYTRRRIAQLSDRIKAHIHPNPRSLDELLVAGPIAERIGFEQAMQLDYRPAELGMQLAPPWHTFWFQASVRFPAEWDGRRVDLLWNTHSENTLWIDGRAIQGMNAGENQARPDATLTNRAEGGSTMRFALETACNKNFGVGSGGKKFAHISDFVLDRAEVAAFNPLAWELYYDLHILVSLEADLSQEKGNIDPSFAGELLYELNRFANEIDETDSATWPAAHKILKNLYQNAPAGIVHELSAIGHAHIDTAWLWPLAETTRKCQRSFGTATAYMAEYPEYKFACSQAYQYHTIEHHDPDLFERIKQAHARGQWICVGGTWIEPDCNIPSGESLIRQFLYGQRYFEKHFGRRCREFWNPDVFGYNGQLPQIMRHCDVSRFLTQKLSWNYFNQPHFHTFNWTAVDGTTVLAHFPPADTYNAHADVKQLRFNAHNYKDADRSRHSLMLFGHGDGGGGPTREMLEHLRRAANLQGLPRTRIRSSDEFFDLLESETRDRLNIIGELYFELHRGTYTSQALTKRNNRYGEVVLHNLELLASIAHRTGTYAYPHETLDKLWHTLLLNQFHDILPGSSITQVYKDAKAQFEAFFQTADRLLQDLLANFSSPATGPRPINTIAFCRRELSARPDGTRVTVEADGIGPARIIDNTDPVSLAQTDSGYTLENQNLRAVLDHSGRMTSLIEKASGRESLDGAGNVFELYDDRPTRWDAWDVEPPHLETGRPVAEADSSRIIQEGPESAQVEFSAPVGKASRLTFVVRLESFARRLEVHCRVDWHEDHKFLKVAFPIKVVAMNATYEMQFHAVERPTHANTPFDLAKFEVPGHRWADLSEHGFGVALLTESKYGFSTQGNRLYLSLLRAPKHPDPEADQGMHEFAFALYPHVGGRQQGGVVAEAMRFNHPILWTEGSSPASKPGEPKPQDGASSVFDDPSGRPWFEIDDENLVLDTVKKAEDDDGLILRFYEAHGGRGSATFRTTLPFTTACYCNGLEDEGEPIAFREGELTLPYQPWKIITVKLK